MLEVMETDHDYQLAATYTDAPATCPQCGAPSPFQRFGSKEQVFLDLPVHGKRVGVHVQRQRYRCKTCGRTFLQPLPDMDDQHAMTKRLLVYVQREALRETFVRVAEQVGVSEGTIRNIFRAHVADLEARHQFITPRQLGIDEIHLLGTPRCVVANVEERSIIDLLVNRNKATVLNRLLRLDDRAAVELVMMDMWQPYRDAARTAFPDAVIIVDKFHVVRMANQAVETVRKTIRQSLSASQRRGLMHDRFILLKRRHELDAVQEMLLQTWTTSFPELATAYQLKEAFFDIYTLQDRMVAEQVYHGWQASIPATIASAFQPLTAAIANWHTEVFAYFDHRITNAYAESLNSLIRRVDRAGRGYSFEALRAKMLFSAGLHRQHRPKYQRQVVRETLGQMRFRTPVQLDPSSVEISYGADISTLIEQLETQAF